MQETMTVAYEPKPGEIAGFDLIGYKQPDGSYFLGDVAGTHVKDFPRRVSVCGMTYNLETVRSNDTECGPLPDGHAGKNIFWGVYV